MATQEDFVVREVTLSDSVFKMSVTRHRDSKGYCKISAKVQGQTVLSITNEDPGGDGCYGVAYEKAVRSLSKLLHAIADDPCKLPTVV